MEIKQVKHDAKGMGRMPLSAGFWGLQWMAAAGAGLAIETAD